MSHISASMIVRGDGWPIFRAVVRQIIMVAICVGWNNAAAQNSDCIDPQPPVPLGTYVPPSVHPRCLCVPPLTGAMPLMNLDQNPTLPGSCVRWGNCWTGAASKTFNDSTRDANALLALHEPYTDEAGRIQPRNLFLSFSIEVPGLVSSQLSLNKLRIGFQRLELLPVDTLTVVTVPHDTVAELQLKNRFLVPGATTDKGEGLAAALDIAFFDLSTSVTNGMAPATPTTAVALDGSDLIKEPRLWYTAGDKGFIGIQLMLPADTLRPIGWTSDDPGNFPSERAYKIWYEFEIANQVDPNGASASGGMVDAGSNYVRSYVWPAISSVYVGASVSGLADRQYPAPAQWGTFMPYGSSTATSCPIGGVDLAASQIYLDNGVAGISLTGANRFVAAPQVINFPMAGNGNQVQGNFRVAHWGSQPIGVDEPWSDIPDCSPHGVTQFNSGANPALTIGCALTTPLPALTGDSGLTATSQLIPSTRVDMSDAAQFRYVRKSAVNNFVYLNASSIDIPAEITTKGLLPPPGKNTHDLYMEVIEHNMPKHAKRVPGGRVQEGWGGRTLPLKAEIDTLIRRLATGQRDVKQQQDKTATVVAGTDTDKETRAELLRHGIQSGQITAEILRKMISADLMPIETVETVVPTYRVRVFHDIGQQDKINGVLHQVVEPQYAFGFAALHAGDLTGWRTDLQITSLSQPDGIKISQFGSKVYKISNVPTNGSIRVVTHAEALAPKPWSIGFLLGTAIPTGTFGDQAKAGPTGTLTLEREWLINNWPPMISAAINVNTARIRGDALQPLSDTTISAVGAGFKVYLNDPADWRIYVLPTVDTYHVSQVGNKSGGSLAFGLQRELTPAWSLELRYGLHRIRNNEPQSHFSTLQAGLRFSY